MNNSDTVNCENCDILIIASMGYSCAKCGLTVCGNCYDDNASVCLDCANDEEE